MNTFQSVFFIFGILCSVIIVGATIAVLIDERKKKRNGSRPIRFTNLTNEPVHINHQENFTIMNTRRDLIKYRGEIDRKLASLGDD